MSKRHRPKKPLPNPSAKQIIKVIASELPHPKPTSRDPVVHRAGFELVKIVGGGVLGNLTYELVKSNSPAASRSALAFAIRILEALESLNDPTYHLIQFLPNETAHAYLARILDLLQGLSTSYPGRDFLSSLDLARQAEERRVDQIRRKAIQFLESITSDTAPAR